MSFFSGLSQPQPRAVLIFEGARGDEQPYVVAGRALKNAGFRVLLAGAGDLAKLSEGYGIELCEYLPHMEDLVVDPCIVNTLTKNSTIRFLAEYERITAPVVQAGMPKLVKALQDFKPDLILGNIINHLMVLALSNALDCAGLLFNIQATVPSNCIPALGFMPRFPVWTGLNRLAWNILAKVAVYDTFVKTRLPLLEQLLGKSREEFWPSYQDYVMTYWEAPDLPFPMFIGASKILEDPLPSDFKPQHRVLGFMRVNVDGEIGECFGTPSERRALQDFLAAGPPPIYMGFGSMVCVSPKWMTLQCLRTLKLTGERCILCTAWSGMGLHHLEGPDAPADAAELRAFVAQKVLIVHYAPHEWLFPRCKVLVHHGGLGTFVTAACAGVPSVIVPVFFDQFEHGLWLEQHNIGVRLKEGLKKTTPEAIVAAIQRCAGSAPMRESCRKVAEALRVENGPKAFAEELLRYYKEEVVTGRHRAKVKERRQRLPPKPKAKSRLAMFAWCCGS